MDVAQQRDLDVTWRFICLRIINADKVESGQLDERMRASYDAAVAMLRIAAAARDKHGNESVGRFYTELGVRMHDQGRSRAELHNRDFTLIDEAMKAAGLDESLRAAGDDARFDALLKEEGELGFSRVGRDVGTPILTFDPGTDREASFFGPVIRQAPKGDEATRLYDLVVELARTPGLYELKRSNRERPVFD